LRAFVVKGLGAFFCNTVTAKHPPHFAPKLASNRCERFGRFLFVRDAIPFRSRGGLVQTAAATKREGVLGSYATRNTSMDRSGMQPQGKLAGSIKGARTKVAQSVRNL
jgi:hypothetical protein